MKLGEKIKNIRTQCNMTMQELADKSNVSKGYISMLEKGENPKTKKPLTPSLEKVQNIASAFELDLESLLDGVDGNIKLPSPTRKYLKKDILNIYNQLNNQRQQLVYLYAENQFEEQLIEESINTVNDDKVEYITDYLSQDQHDINIQSELSAGTGILDLDPENVETITYTGKLPTNYDLAFKVSGDSMEPLFEDGEIVFVRKQLEPINGAIMAVQIDEEAFIKKVYVEADRVRFVSLNKKYPDFYADNGNDIRIIGKVVY